MDEKINNAKQKHLDTALISNISTPNCRISQNHELSESRKRVRDASFVKENRNILDRIIISGGPGWQIAAH